MKTTILLIAAVFAMSNSIGQIQTCQSGYVLCDSRSVNVNYMLPVKSEVNSEMPCFPEKKYYNEITFYWLMDEDKTIELDLIPLDSKDDLDFILYQLNENDLSCGAWNSIRCMSEGPNLIDQNQWYPCAGITGLSLDSYKNEILYGCDLPSTNYLSAIAGHTGSIYALRVMNFTSFNGFILQFRNSPAFKPASNFPLESASLNDNDISMVHATGCIQKVGTTITKDEEVLNSTLITVYPNPTSGILYVNTNSSLISSYAILDPSGRIISFNKVGGVNSFSVTTSSLLPGLYLIDLEDQNEIHVFRQFIKL